MHGDTGDWDHEKWGGELPTHGWIDHVTPDHFVFVCRLDGHMCLASKKALEAANITKDSPEVKGGTIERYGSYPNPHSFS